MRAFVRIMGHFVLIVLITVHVLIVLLLVAPVPKLLGLVLEGEAGFLQASDIPAEVGAFIGQNKIEVKGDYDMATNYFEHLIFKLLKIKHDRFMDPDEQLALNMNLLNYGKGVVGLHQAAEFYYKKTAFNLSDQEWLTLINLQKIFSKK